MADPFENDEMDYLVLINAEGQHSLWPAFRQVPAGWELIGPRGPRQLCLDWIESHWADMRPKSVAGGPDGPPRQVTP